MFLLHHGATTDHSCKRFGTEQKDNEKLIICQCNKCLSSLKNSLVLHLISKRGLFYKDMFYLYSLLTVRQQALTVRSHIVHITV